MRRMILLLAALLLSLGGTVTAQERRLNVGDASIAYDVTGRGRTVVFIHGWTHNRSVWDDQVPVFSKRYRVIRYDSRGFGKSTGFADESAEPLDLLVLLEALPHDLHRLAADFSLQLRQSAFFYPAASFTRECPCSMLMQFAAPPMQHVRIHLAGASHFGRPGP